MLKNYFVSALRNFARHRTYFILNLFGLTIGIASFILIALYMINELSYDRFHPGYENIYRVHTQGMLNGQKLDMAVNSYPVGQALLSDFPEIDHVTQVREQGTWVIGNGKSKFNERKVLFADSSFFNVFDFGLVAGDLKSALTNPKSLVLTASYAEKYFGSDNAIGQKLSVERDTSLWTVTAIINDIPDHSHIKFDILGSSVTYARAWFSQSWTSLNFYTYIKTNPSADEDELEEKIQSLVIKYIGPQIQNMIGTSIDQWINSGNAFGYYLMPLKDIYFESKTSGELERGSDRSYLFVYTIVALIIIIMAIINFINLATAQSSSRAKEVGVRKVVGSTKSSLIKQFIFESILVSFLSTVLATLVVEASLKTFEELVGKNLVVGIIDNWLMLIFIVLLSLIIGLLAGFYPAFVLAAYRPVEVLKGILNQGAKSSFVRKFLVTTQFTASIAIMVCTIVIYQQIQFMLNKNLGFEKEQILVIRRSDNLRKNIETFKSEILTHANVSQVAYSTTIPGKPHGNESYVLADQPGLPYVFDENIVSFDYCSLYGLDLVEGRLYDPTLPSDSNGYIVNQAAVKALQLLDPIGKEFIGTSRDGRQKYYFPVIGVVKDFNYRSLRNEVAPLIMRIMKGNQEGFISIKLKNTRDVRRTVEYLETQWDKYTNDKPFDYFFFDDDYERLYRSESTTARILLVFSILSVFIACLGLIGLITYTTTIRRKEIGIRKVVGADSKSLVRLLSSEFLKLTIISMFFAWPIAYFVTKSWLENFADRLTIGVMPYLASTAVVIIIGGIAISFQTIKAATGNPSDALRQE